MHVDKFAEENTELPFHSQTIILGHFYLSENNQICSCFVQYILQSPRDYMTSSANFITVVLVIVERGFLSVSIMLWTVVSSQQSS